MAALDRTGDFALLDSEGQFHQLSRYQHRRAVILMAYSASCQGMDESLAKYQELHEEFAAKGVEFFLIDPQGLERPALQGLNTGLPILQDKGQLVSEALGLSYAGEVRVLNPGRLSLFYKGGVGAELENTLAELLVDSVRNTVESVGAVGCELQFPVRDRHLAKTPDYATEVAPIIIENCVQCHRQWGAGPFAMDKYISLLGWSPMIKEVLLNKRMPPAQVDPDIGHSTTARYIAPDDIQTLVHWINAGGPRGESTVDPLEQLTFNQEEEWLLGEPDFIVSTPVHQVPANGVIDDIYVDMELPFDEDKWIRAVQYQPTANGTLHHLITLVTAPEEDFWGEERESTVATRRFIEGYSPGKAVVSEFSDGSAVFVPKGHKLSMQFQYVGMGADVNNITKIGLYFTDGSKSRKKERLVQAVVAKDFVLPPDQNEIPMTAEYVFTEDVIVTGVRARMNERGKRMKFSVETPDGTVSDILSIPAYNYAWQPHYILEKPVQIAAGSKVRIVGAFDNSVSNPFNPDPTLEVASGTGILDEMFAGYFTYYKDGK